MDALPAASPVRPGPAGFPISSHRGSQPRAKRIQAGGSPANGLAIPRMEEEISREAGRTSDHGLKPPRNKKPFAGRHRHSRGPLPNRQCRSWTLCRPLPAGRGRSVVAHIGLRPSRALPSSARVPRAFRFPPNADPAAGKENTGPREPREWPCHPANGRRNFTRSGADLGSWSETTKKQKTIRGTASPFAGSPS